MWQDYQAKHEEKVCYDVYRRVFENEKITIGPPLKISQAGAKGREKDKSKILEELRRDRQRREEEARREKAAIKLQKALRPWYFQNNFVRIEKV